MPLIIQVHVRVKSEDIEAFKTATAANARSSLQEGGIARFDVLQQADDPAAFILMEAYRNSEAPNLHKSTEHYRRWREIVEPMMAEPRRSVRFNNVFPDDGGW